MMNTAIFSFSVESTTLTLLLDKKNYVGPFWFSLCRPLCLIAWVYTHTEGHELRKFEVSTS